MLAFQDILERYSVRSCARSQCLTDSLSALVPGPADGQGNGKDTEPKKDINILTYTAGRMAFMGSADTRQAGSSSMQGIVKLLHLVFCMLFILDFLFSHDLNWHCCL